MNRFVFTDPSSCIGCSTCEVACVLAHPIGDSEMKTMSSTNFQPRVRLVKDHNITSTIQCRHCDDAACVNVCPTNALVYIDDTVQLIEDRCIGCKTCVIACPYGAMNMVCKPVKTSGSNDTPTYVMRSVAYKCNLCIDRPAGPACVEVCPTNAMQILTSETLDEILKQKRISITTSAG